MLISILEKINNLNEMIFAPLDGIIEKLPLEDWIVDAIVDSLHLLPFLFFIFFLIEIIEFYFSDKMDACIKKARKRSVAVGALASIFPQCGFSVIASSLYSRRMITRGCLIAVYLGTSDETIPILLAHPEKAHLIIPIVGLKLLIAIVGGYLIDIIAGHFNNPDVINHEDSVEEAMAANCQLIVRKSATFSEFVKNEKTAYVAEYSETLTSLCLDYLNGQIKPTTEEAYNLISNYNLENFGQNLMKVYESLVTEQK